MLRWISLFVLSLPAFAGEYAILSSGLRMHIERHENSSGVLRLYHSAGVIELPEGSVTGFEQDDYVAPASPAPAPAPIVAAKAPLPPKSTAELLREAAQRSGLPPEFVTSVARVESGLRPDAISPKGAIGVMQLMPETAKALGADPADTEQNIDAGTKLLRDLLLKYDGDVVKALAAYNAGPGAVDRFGGLPPYNETRYYVNKVIGAYQQAGGK